MAFSARAHLTSAEALCSCGSSWWPCWTTRATPTSSPGPAAGWSSSSSSPRRFVSNSFSFRWHKSENVCDDCSQLECFCSISTVLFFHNYKHGRRVDGNHNVPSTEFLLAELLLRRYRDRRWILIRLPLVPHSLFNTLIARLMNEGRSRSPNTLTVPLTVLVLGRIRACASGWGLAGGRGASTVLSIIFSLYIKNEWVKGFTRAIRS